MSNFNQEQLNHLDEIEQYSNSTTENTGTIENEFSTEKKTAEVEKQTAEELTISKTQSLLKSSADNIKNLEKGDWRLKQIESALQNLSSDKKNFYEIKENGNVEYYMDLVKDYLNLLKDKSWIELKSRNTAALIMAVQISLEYQGFEVGKIDGVFGNLTKNAILNYKRKMKAEGAKILINSRPDSILIHGLLSGMEKIDSQKAKQEDKSEGQPVEEAQKPLEEEQQNSEQPTEDGEKAQQQKPTEGQAVEKQEASEGQINSEQQHTEDEQQQTTEQKAENQQEDDEGQKVEGQEDEQPTEELMNIDYILKSRFGHYRNGKYEFNSLAEKKYDKKLGLNYIKQGNEIVYYKESDNFMDIGIFENGELKQGIREYKDGTYFKGGFENGEYDGKGEFYTKLPRLNYPTQKLNYDDSFGWPFLGTFEKGKLVSVEQGKVKITYENGKAQIYTPQGKSKLEMDTDKLYTNLHYILGTITKTTYHPEYDGRIYDFMAEGDNLMNVDIHTKKENENDPSKREKHVVLGNTQENFGISAQDIANFATQYRADLRQDYLDKKAKEEAERKKREEERKKKWGWN